jgi:acetate kinase
VESTLSFTALDGLCMGTRPGALDPGVVLHLFQGLKMSAKDVETLLYKKCGLLGISGISNDMRDLLGRPEPEARLAVDYFVYRAAKEIGALAAVLRGVDAIVFTAGIGENSAAVRAAACARLAWLGVAIDESANAAKGDRDIATPASRVRVLVINTQEEREIAREVQTVLAASV